MIACKPVAVQRNAFHFCRSSLAIALWLALFLRLPWLVAACAVILGLSAALTVGRAPMVALYSETFGRVWSGGTEILDERAMRFAHSLGAAMCAICTVLIYVWPRGGYAFLVTVATLKTAGALGFCSAVRLYGCVNSDTCCSWIGKRA
jgi:uncharacterized membrane protein YccC